MDSVRKLWEAQQAIQRAADPLGDLGKHLDPLGDAYRRSGIGSEAIRMLQEPWERQRLLAGIIGSYHQSGLDVATMMRMASEAAAQHKLMAGPLEEARRLGLFDPQSDIRRAMQTAMEEHQRYEGAFRLPDFDEVARLAHDAFDANTLASTAFRDVAELQAAMEAMRHPWLSIDDLARSAAGFAEMQAIGRVLIERPPFEATTAVALRPHLGDWRDVVELPMDLLVDPLQRSRYYATRGFNFALTDFTALAFDESAVLADLRAPPPAEDDEIIDEDEIGYTRNRAAFDRLQRFEVEVRRFIERVMHATFGDSWLKQQMPAEMLGKWQVKKDIALKAGEPDRPLIEYADFTDYKAIIERTDNWSSVFKPFFGRPEDVRESFQRLFPVRICTMHSRIITLDDEMLLVVETKRILRAMARAK